MDIRYALKMTGKATTATETTGFVSVGEDGILYWFNRLTGMKMLAVKLEGIGRNDWISYHPKEEIKPKEAGELWKQGDSDEDHNYYHTFESESGELKFRARDIFDIKDWPGMIHGKNGWERFFPIVEDAESTHRDSDTKTITIKDVKWKKETYPSQKYYGCVTNCYHPDIGHALTRAEHEALLKEEPMTVTLTMKKNRGCESTKGGLK